jgi:small GTP-binding protein
MTTTPETSEGNALQPLIKLMLLGDCAVGKTSLLDRYTRDPDDVFGSTLSTIGIDFRIKLVEVPARAGAFKVQLWDTAGQERYRSITTAFYRNCMGLAIVYDVTSRHSFENVSYWVRMIKSGREEGLGDLCVALIGNKVDLVDKRTVSRTEAQALADRCEMRYFETSTCSGEGVNELFETLVADVVCTRFPSAPGSTEEVEEPTTIRLGSPPRSPSNNNSSSSSSDDERKSSGIGCCST